MGSIKQKDMEALRAYNRAYYAKNRATRLATLGKHAYARKKKRREWLSELKAKPCMDCGNSFPPVCMDFDHRDGSEKVGNVSALYECSLQTLLNEIAKCDLVCANCHRLRTHSRK